MSGHEQFDESLALYALGGLQAEERSTLAKHLAECSACLRELEKLRGDMALMALSTTGSSPPRRARQRLIDAIAREPRAGAVQSHRSWWAPLPWLATAAGVLVAGGFWWQSHHLAQRVADLEQALARQQTQLQRSGEVVGTLTARDAMRVTLVAVKTPPQPQGKAIYVRSRSSLIFLASNLPALPPTKAYELWLIPTNGAPIPAGVFKPDAHGSATVVNPPLPTRVEAKTFAITVEPEEGSSVPTMPIVMMGAGE